MLRSSAPGRIGPIEKLFTQLLKGGTFHEHMSLAGITGQGSPKLHIRVYRHKRIESYIGTEHVFCLLACVERLLNPGCFLRLSHNTRLQHGLISTFWASTISPTKTSEKHLEFSP